MIDKCSATRTIFAVVASCLLALPIVSLVPTRMKTVSSVFSIARRSTAGTLMNGAKFVAEDGVIKHNDGSGWLRDKEYADFILRLEFRFLKPEQDGGVFLRAGNEGKDWPDRKYEVQVENMRRMATIFNAKNDLNVELTQKSLKPDGE